MFYRVIGVISCNDFMSAWQQCPRINVVCRQIDVYRLIELFGRQINFGRETECGRRTNCARQVDFGRQIDVGTQFPCKLMNTDNDEKLRLNAQKFNQHLILMYLTHNS